MIHSPLAEARNDAAKKAEDARRKIKAAIVLINSIDLKVCTTQERMQLNILSRPNSGLLQMDYRTALKVGLSLRKPGKPDPTTKGKIITKGKFPGNYTPAPQPQRTKIDQAITYLEGQAWTTISHLRDAFSLDTPALNAVLSHFQGVRLYDGIIHKD